MSLVFRYTNLFTAAASVCGVTLEPNRPTPPSVCAPTDRTPPPVCGPPRPPTGPPLRSVGLRWALKPRTRPVHYNATLVLVWLNPCGTRANPRLPIESRKTCNMCVATP